MKLQIVDILKKVLLEDGIKIRGVYERSDAKERLKEGMDRKKGFIGDEFDTDVEIVENGVRYIVDVKDGQKTGFFLDQKYNRLAMQRICKDMDVLDCFTHTGSFALNAGIAGAKHVLGVDASELAVAQAQKNAALNNLSDTVEFKCADVFDLLPALENEGKQFDVVILDPPAFTKSKNAIKNAVKGYREINLRGMKLVKDGGYLATCSCSHYMNAELFAQTIGQAARAAHCRLRQVEFRTQSPDNIKGLVWTLAVPSMLSQLVSVLYSIVDRMYIGNIPSNGTQALAGVGVCGPIVTLISSFAFLVGIGGAPLVSINLGEKNIDAAKKVIANCFVYILALAVPVTVLAYIFRRPILLTFGATEAVYPYAETYFSLYLLGTVFALTATVYHHTGPQPQRHVLRFNRRHHQHCARPHFYLRSPYGRRGRGHRHGHFAGCKLRVRAVRPVWQTYRSSHHIWRIRFKSHRPCDEHRHERVPHYSFR